MNVTIIITGPQGCGKSLIADRLKTFLAWMGIANVRITERQTP